MGNGVRCAAGLLLILIVLACLCCREGGYYPLTMEFSEDYPARPPKVKNPTRPISAIRQHLLMLLPQYASPSNPLS
jgi:Ubiquitin-conjugating enzyme